MKHSTARFALLSATLCALPLFTSASTWMPADPPSIQDILGTYEFTASEKGYEFGIGEGYKEKDTETVRISQPVAAEGLGSNVVRLSFLASKETIDARYVDGFLMFAGTDETTPASIGTAVVIEMKGKPGKIKGKGKGLDFDLFDGYVAELKLKIKQVSNPR